MISHRKFFMFLYFLIYFFNASQICRLIVLTLSVDVFDFSVPAFVCFNPDHTNLILVSFDFSCK